MEFQGMLAFLDVPEQQALGCGSPEPIEVINQKLVEAYDANTHRVKEIRSRQSADDDELTHSERASILPDALDVSQDRLRLDRMLKQLHDHERGFSLET